MKGLNMNVKEVKELKKPSPEKIEKGLLVNKKDVQKIKSALEEKEAKSIDEKLNPKDISFGRITGCEKFCSNNRPTGHANGTY